MNTDEPDLPPRGSYILSIWPQGAPTVWRGFLETPDGRRVYFITLGQLNQLLRQRGWRDENGPKRL